MDIEDLKTKIAPLVEESGLILYSLTYKKDKDTNILEVVVDKKGDVNIDDVTKATNLINDYLDKCDPIEEEYTLEVMSRGIEKEFDVDDAQDYINQYVLVKTIEQTFLGTLIEKSDGIIVIKDKRNKKIKIYTNDVVEIKTTIDF